MSESEATGRLKKFLDASVKMQASDILIRPGEPVRFRLRGTLRSADAPPFTNDEFDAELKDILSEKQWNDLETKGSVDMAYALDEDNRFRVNLFRTMGRRAIAARRISSKILSYADLHLPPSMEKIAEAHQGLILLCGVTGSGKSTTIASMLQQINDTRACHILTIEDPVEFMFRDSKAMVNQREVGIDVPDFATALRALVRENPDVVLIGEMRDRETFEAAIQAAETGHLVFGTIHASSCAGAFGRIYNLFEVEERELIRDMFAYSMKAIIYQRLLKSLREDVHRVPAVEILLNNPIVTKRILEGREVELTDIIRQCEGEGMLDLNSSLVELVNKEYIHPRSAMEAARNPDELKMRLKGISSMGTS